MPLFKILLVFILILTFYSLRDKHRVTMHRLYGEPAPNTQKTSYNPKYENIDSKNPRNPSFYNIMTEEEALMFKSCHNINEAASIDYSKVIRADRFNETYYLGEDIKVSVFLYDGYRNRKYSGGDQVRATIENKVLRASAPCLVTDNKDGRHTIMCKALWSGHSTVFVTLAYTRESITAFYRIRTETLAARNIYGGFRNGPFSEATTCHPIYKQLLKLTNYTELCNMTSINSGMPFYCGKPNNVHLLCEHWKLVRYQTQYDKLPLTDCERHLIARGHRTLTQHVNVTIKGLSGNKTILVAKPTIPCSEYNVSLTWHSRQPTGFFYKRNWMSQYCLGYNKTAYMSCLKNRRIYLLGDSTTRQWYSAIVKRFRCQPVTKPGENDHRDIACFNKKIDFHARFYVHSQPFFAGLKWDFVTYTLHSIASRLESIQHKTNAIVVVHLFLHVLAFHHSVFRLRMEKIRKSIELFLNKARHPIVMIKGPHTFDDTPERALDFVDYYGYVFSKILYEVFDGLHDRVILLNNRDATFAQHTRKVHPPEIIVNAMIDQMLDHVCKQQ